MLKTIPLEEAVGNVLSHDITEIRPGEFKGPAFRKGHTLCEDEICHLQRLGKNHLYVIDLEKDEIHENEAAAILARALAGEGIVWEDDPREGKISLYAESDGLLVVDTLALAGLNMVDEVMCATLHNHTPSGHESGTHRTSIGHRPAERMGVIDSAYSAGQGRPGDHRKRGLQRSHQGSFRSHPHRETQSAGLGSSGFGFCSG